MKKILIVILFAASFSAKSQSNSIDSLGNIIKTMQKQIADLQKMDTLVFTPSQMTLTRTSPTKQTVSINNYASFLSVSNATQLTAALLRITTLETQLKALQTKVTALKAVSTTTTTIQ